MKFDTIIIGGGLSALTCGIKLAKAGRDCLIIASGESALSFNSGSFGLLSRLPDGTAVEEPLKAIEQLPSSHPYVKIGIDNTRRYAASAKEFFADCGISLRGTERNLWRYTSSGKMKRCWLAMEDTTAFVSREDKVGDKALIVTVKGFQDFFPGFVAESLEKKGISCRCESIELDELDMLRSNASEMRATNIALTMEKDKIRKSFVKEISRIRQDEDMLILPQIFGYEDTRALEDIRKAVGMPVTFISTLMPSVPGIRTQKMLKKAFEAAGGTLMMGDCVTGAVIEGGKIKSVLTSNLGNYGLEADNFVLATGSFFGKGLASDFTKIYEPVLGLDVDASEKRDEWYSSSFFDRQAFIGFGVKTDNDLHPSRDGEAISNLYAAGSVLSGAESLYEGSGAGVAIITAMYAADKILEG